MMPTNQEIIREGIVTVLKKYANFGYDRKAMEVVNCLHSQGVVLKVEVEIKGNTLTNDLWDAISNTVELEDCRILVLQALRKAGYTLTESLVKE